jgi:hypothetical protein
LTSAAQKWVVCEASGRWAAALRVLFAGSQDGRVAPYLNETRTLGELSQHCADSTCDLSLIEVGRANLTDVLRLLLRRGRRPDLFVALLDEPEDAAARRLLADLLWEAGAADVIASPRQMGGLPALHCRIAALRRPTTVGLAEGETFADWARSTLPWQEP